MKSKRPTPNDPGVPVAARPQIGHYSAPAGFFFALAILMYLGQIEGCYNHGQFSAAVYEPYVDVRSIPRAGGEVNRVESGREVYGQLCVACHQPNGSGNPANQCPPLAGSDWVAEEGPGRLIRIVLHGARGEITVNGQVWNSASGMLPFGFLPDEQIANVISYIRGESAWGNKFPEVTPEMVGKVRKATEGRTAPWTAAELLKIPTAVEE